MALPDYLAPLLDLDIPAEVYSGMESAYDEADAANVAALADKDGQINSLTVQLAASAAVVEALQQTNLALIQSGAYVGGPASTDDGGDGGDGGELDPDSEEAEIERGENLTLDDMYADDDDE